mmetsp:Transcript_896/g.2413  ORF Transcript_896/g.2413 Transcript_896/m.2413 type:complete len:484 (-) Transcript_896:141-1592(-)
MPKGLPPIRPADCCESHPTPPQEGQGALGWCVSPIRAGGGLVGLARVAEVGADVHGLFAELLLDAQQLVVLGQALGAAGRARLDLTGIEADGEVGDEGVLRLARAVARHHAPPRALGGAHGLDRLGDGADLVDLEQQRVARLLLDGALHADGVGHQQVVADDLHLVAHAGGDRGEGVEVVLGKGVLDRDDGVLRHEGLVERLQRSGREHVVGRLGLVLKAEVIVALLGEELGGGHIHADLDLAFVARLLDGHHHKVEPLLVGEDVGRKAALVAHVGRVLAVLLVDDLLQVVVDLRTHLHRMAEVVRANRQDHELLHRELVTRVRAAVDNVEGGHGQLELRVARQVSDVLVERHLLGGGAGAARRERDAEDCVGAELGLAPAELVGGAVEHLNHELVERLLVGRVHPEHLGADDRVDVVNGLHHALAHPVRLHPVAQLESLVRARARTARHRRAEEAVLSRHVHLHRRIAAAVEDLARLDRLDR